MRALIRGDLRGSWRVWSGALLALVVVATVSGWLGVAAAVGAASIDFHDIPGQLQAAATAALPSSSVVALGLVSATATTGIFTAVVMIVTVGNVASLVVSQRRREIALWQLSGMTDRQVQRVVTVQLLIVGALASAIGAVIGMLTSAGLVGYLAENGLVVAGMRADVAPAGVLVGAAVGFAMMTLGARISGRSISRIEPLEVLRADGISDHRAGRARAMWAGLVALATIGLFTEVARSTPQGVSNIVLLALVAYVASASVAGPLVFGPVVRVWTALIPATVAPVWHLARRALAASVTRAVATITPVATTVALMVGLLSSDSTMARGLDGHEHTTLFSVIALIGLPMIVAVSGAVVMVFMAGRQREREVALAALAGTTPGQQVRQALYESIIITVTGVVVGFAGVVVALLCLQPVLLAAGGHSAIAVNWPVLTLVTGVVFCGTAAATLAPTISSMRTPTIRAIRAS